MTSSVRTWTVLVAGEPLADKGVFNGTRLDVEVAAVAGADTVGVRRRRARLSVPVAEWLREQLFISYKFVKGCLAITFLLLRYF